MMRTIHLDQSDLGGFREALRGSRDETLIVHQGGYRIIMARGEVISSSGHSEVDVTPVELDSRGDKMWSNGRAFDRPRWSEAHRRRIAAAMNEDIRDDIDTDLIAR